MRKNLQQKNVLGQSSGPFGLVEDDVNLLLQNASSMAPTSPIPQNIAGGGTAPTAQSLPRVDGNQQNKPKFKKDTARDTLGPKIKEAQGNGWGYDVKNFVTKNKSILPLLLGIAAAALVGVFAMNVLTSGQDTETRVRTGTTEATVVASLTTASGLATSTGTTSTSGGSSATFIQKAASGEGVTHLARRTLAAYLTETGYTLSAEQKVYAEDYLKDITGSFALSVGQEVSFDHTDVETAYTLSLELEDWQIENLTQYTL